MKWPLTIPVISENQWLCTTVYQEARLEPIEGKIAIVHVILNRARSRNMSISDVCLSPWQFSAWNTDSLTRSKLDTIDGNDWYECSEAVTKARYGNSSDPTGGATHYLNVDVVMRLYKKLPWWYDEKKITIKIGLHTFLKLEPL